MQWFRNTPNTGRNTRVARVAMIHSGRCGSTVLGDMLGQHRDIFWDGEIFDRVRESKNSWLRSPFYPDRPMDFLSAREQSARKPIYGFEIKFHDLEHNEIQFEQLLQNLERQSFSHFVILSRKNLLKAVVSGMVAMKSSKFHQSRGKKVSAPHIELDFAALPLASGVSLLQLLEQLEKELDVAESALADRNMLRLFYENQIQTDPENGYASICSFLGIRPQKTRVRFEKTTPYPLREVLTNFDAVSDHLAGTKFEWMLRE